MKSRTLILATIAVWIIVVVAAGVWKLNYAWRWGGGVVYFLLYVPVLIVLLVIVLSIEIFVRPWRS
jgi:hypothetical protein